MSLIYLVVFIQKTNKNRVLRGNGMFGKKKLYEIIWKTVYSYTTIIVAKNEEQALKKFYKKYDCMIPSIISFKEYKIG